jgi:hypothetical protein
MGNQFRPLRVVHKLLRRGEKFIRLNYRDWARLLQDSL